MAERLTRGRKRTRAAPWDTTNPANWTSDKLKAELDELGITVPSNMSKSMLKQMYLDNIGRRREVHCPERGDRDGAASSSLNNPGSESVNTASAEASIPDSVEPSPINNNNSVSVEPSPIASNNNNSGDSVLIREMLSAMQSMQNTVAGLQKTVTNIVEQRANPSHECLGDRNSQNTSGNTLATAYADFETAQPQQVTDGAVHTIGLTLFPARSAGSAAAMPSASARSSAMELQPVISQLWDAAIACRTRQSYLSGFNAYVHFLLFSGIIAFLDARTLPVTEDLLIQFAAHCVSRLHVAYSTIKLYICGVRFLCLEKGIRYPVNNEMQRLPIILKGVKRVQTKNSKSRYPITFDILRRICLLLRKGVYQADLDLLLETVCTVAFFGFLRCGEFAVTGSFDPALNLCLQDLVIVDECVMLTLKASKTDSFREGVTIKLFRTDSIICPYDICSKYMKARRKMNTSPSSPLFINGSGAALSRSEFIARFKHILDCLGINSELYNGHSFRIGAATSAGASLVEDHLIKILGRWSSDAYCRYIKTSEATLKKAQNALTKP